MNFLLTVRMPQNEIIDQLPQVWQDRLEALGLQYHVVGRINGNRKIANAIMNSTFVGPDDIRVDENDVLLERTEMPPSWTLLAQHVIQRGSDLMKVTFGTPVTIDAGIITDTTIEHSQWYARYYVEPVIDNTNPANPITTGVRLMDRVGNFIEQIDGGVPVNDGSYTKTWTVPGKDVPGVGKVVPDTLEPNGDYIHTPFTISVDKPAVEEMTPMDPEYIEFMPDEVDENGENPTRPTQAAEMVLFGGYKRSL